MKTISRDVNESCFIDLLISEAPIGIALVDENLRYVYVNNTLAEMNGIPVDDHLGLTVEEALPRLGNSLTPVLQHVLESGTTVTFEVRGTTPAEPDEKRDWLCCYYPVRNAKGVIAGVAGSVLDVTEKNEANRQLRLLADNIQDVICLHEPDGTYAYCSPSTEKVTGYNPQELIGKSPYELIHPDDRRMVQEQSHTRLLSGLESELITYRLVTKSGRIIWLESTARAIRDEHGVTTGLQTCSREVTGRIEDKIALRDSEMRFRVSVDAMQEGLVLQDSAGVITLCNKAAERILGMSWDRMTGRSSFDPSWRSIHEDGSDFPGYDHPAPVALRTGLPQRDVIMGVRAHGDDPRWIRINAEPIFHAGEDSAYAVVCTFADITDLRKFEEIRAQQRISEDLQRLSDRLISVQEGERRKLAGDLHDEIGGALTGLKLLLEHTRESLPSQSKDEMAQATMLVQEIIATVREMSMDLRPTILDDMGLMPALRWYIQRYTNQTGIRVAIRTRSFDERLRPEIEITLYRLVQEALTNIARHASANRALVSISKTPTGIRVSVRDHGAGFKTDVGLNRADASGIAGIRERLRLVGGILDVSSSPGHGTRIVAHVPINWK